MWGRLRVVGAAALIVAVTTGCGTAGIATSQPATAPATAQPVTSQPPTAPASAQADARPVPADGPIPPGSYRVEAGPWAAVGYTFVMPDGWVAQNGGQTLSKDPDGAGEVGVNPFVITDIYADACGADDVRAVGPTANDLAAALMEQPGPKKTGPADVTLGGRPAKLVTLTIPSELDPTTCDPPIGLQIARNALADAYLVVVEDGTVNLYMADLNGQRLVITTQARSRSTQADIAEMEAIVSSVRIDP